MQGLSLNLDVEPRLLTSLVSCGLRDTEVSSAVALGARATDVEEAARRYAALFAASAGFALEWRAD